MCQHIAARRRLNDSWSLLPICPLLSFSKRKISHSRLFLITYSIRIIYLNSINQQCPWSNISNEYLQPALYIQSLRAINNVVQVVLAVSDSSLFETS